jgi:TIR domain
VKKKSTKPWHMIGVDGKAYLVVLRSALGRVGYREFEPGAYRVRVEPADRATRQVSRLLLRPEWKQPGDQNENRFSAVVRADQLYRMLGVAIRALGAGQIETEFNPRALAWARQLNLARPADSPLRSLVFFSYSHKDQKWLKEFQTMLAPAMPSDILWDDTKIDPGAKWKDEIRKALASAKVAVLLVSKHFLDSSFIQRHELPPLLEAEKVGGLKILWVSVGSCKYQETEIDEYQAAHDPSHPLESLKGSKRQQAIVAICQNIKTAMN